VSRPPASPAALFVDTSGFYVLANANDPYHADARNALTVAGTTGSRVITTNFIVAETHALFLARDGRVVALDAVRRILGGSTSVERITEDDEAAGIEVIERFDDKDFSYVDAVSFVVMRRLDIDTALSSNRHFVQFGFHQAR
jgi:predicted nucleic acid-binding protein